MRSFRAQDAKISEKSGIGSIVPKEIIDAENTMARQLEQKRTSKMAATVPKVSYAFNKQEIGMPDGRVVDCVPSHDPILFVVVLVSVSKRWLRPVISRTNGTV